MALTLKSIEDFRGLKAGVVTILSDDTPSTLTISGADVDGLPDDYVIGAGSVIIAPDADYMAFEEADDNGDTTFTQKYNVAPSEG